MRKWSYGVNNVYRTCRIYCDEVPWWVDPFESVLCWICDHTPHIPLPFLKLFKHVDEDGTVYRLDEWCGGNLHSVFCGYVHHPLMNWATNKIRCVYSIDVGWERGLELFYDDNPSLWDGDEEA